MVLRVAMISVLLVVTAACSQAASSGATDPPSVTRSPTPVPEQLRSTTVSADIEEALENLEAALVRARHPLAEAANRPAGRPKSETQQAARQLLGESVPQELAALWAWWGDSEYPSSLGNWGYQLPGGVTIDSLEAAVEYRDQIPPELKTPVSADWLPVAWVGQETILWFELEACADGQVPVTVTYAWDGYPEESRDWRFGSIAEFVDAMTDLIDNGFWAFAEGFGWHYVGDYGEVQWASPSIGLPDGVDSSRCGRDPRDYELQEQPTRRAPQSP